MLILSGLVCGVGAFRRWMRNEQAMRLGLPLPSSPMLLILTVIVALVALVALAGGEPGMTTAPWDPGLQNERTGLAWQRTMLSGLTCGVLVARVLAEVSVTFAVLTGLLALLSTAALGWLAHPPVPRQRPALHAERPTRGRPAAGADLRPGHSHRARRICSSPLVA